MAGENCSTLTLSTTVVKYDDIFNPADITVYTSEDNKNFTEVAKAEYETEGQNDPNGPKEYTLEFPETSARKARQQGIPLHRRSHSEVGLLPFLIVRHTAMI